MLRVNDFFCGAGGMGLGFKQAGFRLGGAWDFDKYAVESYSNNVSNKVKQVDIVQMTWDEVPYSDVWTFGFPCQDISVAGNQAGMVKGETRSGLFYEVMRLLEETEINSHDRLPSIILAENVKAVNKYLGEIEKEYEARGYKMYATLYNSKYWGVPQNRERYFILGVHKSIDKPFEFLQQQTEYFPKLSSVLEETADEKYYLNNEKAEKIIEQAMKRVELIGVPSDNATKVTITGLYGQKKGFVPSEQSNTLDASAYKGLGCNQARPAVCEIHPISRVRKLTPREYARLQGFPEDYKQVVSNTQFYKQMGNAVTVNVSKAIAEKIAEFLTY